MTAAALPEADLTLALGDDIECECMACDLPLDQPHKPIQWRVHVHFPGTYPLPGDAVMLLCDHCRDDWVHGDWRDLGSFTIVTCTPV